MKCTKYSLTSSCNKSEISLFISRQEAESGGDTYTDPGYYFLIMMHR